MISTHKARKIKDLADAYAAARSRADDEIEHDWTETRVAKAQEALRQAREAFYAAIDRITTK